MKSDFEPSLHFSTCASFNITHHVETSQINKLNIQCSPFHDFISTCRSPPKFTSACFNDSSDAVAKCSAYPVTILIYVRDPLCCQVCSGCNRFRRSGPPGSSVLIYSIPVQFPTGRSCVLHSDTLSPSAKIFANRAIKPWCFGISFETYSLPFGKGKFGQISVFSH